MGAPRTSVLLVDDHPLFRAGLRRLLESDPTLRVAAEAGSGAEALALLRSTAIGMVILDISLPDQSGVELLPRIHAIRRELPVLFLSAHPESGFALPLLRAGARGYLSKQSSAEDILSAVRNVVRGERHVPPAIQQQLALSPEAPLSPHRLLSSRELQVFVRIARGMPPATTAAELKLSVKTISTYRIRILEKLGLASNAEMAAYAVRNHLLDTAIH